MVDGSPDTVMGKSTFVLLSGMEAGNVADVGNVCEYAWAHRNIKLNSKYFFIAV
jgi:ethanolamine utilization protein EutA (predicted chaperonin)